jgi:hypothetical protein
LSPVFLKRLRGLAMEVGQPLHLEVEVGGIPQPEVSLFSNSYFPKVSIKKLGIIIFKYVPFSVFSF